MPVTVGPYGQTQPSCFDRVKMGFMMGFAVGMAAGAMFGTFSCLRYKQPLSFLGLFIIIYIYATDTLGENQF